jgi:hypothetical protein
MRDHFVNHDAAERVSYGKKGSGTVNEGPRRKQRGINIFYLDPGSVSGMTRRRKRRGIKPMLRNKSNISFQCPMIT